MGSPITLRRASALAGVAVTMAMIPIIGPAAPARAHGMSAASPAVVRCAPGPTSLATKTRYNTTPAGHGPWRVPHDPCNTEPLLHWDNCAYWGEEKRPDIWRNAVLPPGGGYSHGAHGAWNIKIDAAKFNYRISHTPKVGDLAAWPPNAKMGIHKSGTRTITHYASSGGHVAYVERVRGRQITISSTGLSTSGGYTFSLRYNPTKTYFIHHGRIT